MSIDPAVSKTLTGKSDTGPSGPAGRRFPWKGLILITILIVTGFLTLQLLSASEEREPSPEMASIRTAPVISGQMERSVRVGGVTSSIVFANVRAPRQQGPERRALILLELLTSGARVKKGDIVARIDGQGLIDHIDDTQATVNAAVSDIKKRRAEQEVDWNNLQQNLRVAQSEWDKWKLEAKASAVRTVIDQELLNLGQEESEVAYKQQLKDLEFEKKMHAAELKILELTTELHRRHVGRHASDLKRYTVVAPMDGMVVRQQVFRNGEFGMVELGDQLHPGVLFLKIMDTSNMQIEATINQAESSLFKIGMKARVGLDAFPELQLEGEVFSIGALAKSGTQSEHVRSLPIRIKIEGSHPKLIPDLSAYADVILESEESVTQVPIGAVVEEDGQAYVYVKNGNGFDKRPVEVGLRNFVNAAIVSGVEPGEEVALDYPAT